MCSGEGDRTLLLPGFPIRKSSDHSSVGSSPRLIAASYVLHRLLVPRHPPCALTNLATKMLASTVQFSSYGRSRSPPTACAPVSVVRRGPVLPRRSPRSRGIEGSCHRGQCALQRVRPDPSGPNSALGPPPPQGAFRSHRQAGCTRSASRARRPTGQCSTLEPHRGTNVLAWVLDEIFGKTRLRCSLERR